MAKMMQEAMATVILNGQKANDKKRKSEKVKK
jgi:hypothetical protein